MTVAELIYEPGACDSHRGFDFGRYGRFDGDPVTCMSLDDVPRLAASADWRDRVRAEQIIQTDKVFLPDGFPCIFETEDSPNQNRSPRTKHRSSMAYRAWVVSPDEDMLKELLPDYQALWDDDILVRNAHWGPSARRLFAVGTLDGLLPSSVYRPGTTPVQVLRATIALHTFRVPEFLRDRLDAYNQYVVRES